MLIQCKQERVGGSVIELPPKSKYHFKPNEEGHHVCEVTDKKHIDMLLSIPEGYHVYGEEPEVVENEEGDDAEGDDAEGEWPENPLDWSNKQASTWAKEQGFNPLNKKEIEKFAATKGVESLDARKSPANMIKDLALALGGSNGN